MLTNNLEKEYRTLYQRDRDHILYSPFFERLAQTTQTFIAPPESQYFRTRLLHTLVVNNIARGIGRGLQLNEDLIEAIALGHDIGHTPYGHMGEVAINELLEERYCVGKFKKGQIKPPILERLKGKRGLTQSELKQRFIGEFLLTENDTKFFMHGRQSYRFLDIIEKANITNEVAFGIMRHSYTDCKLKDDLNFKVEDITAEHLTYEAQVVKIADDIACILNDFEDGVLAGLISRSTRNIVFKRFGETRKDQYRNLIKEVVDEHREKIEDKKCTEFPILLKPETESWLYEIREYIHRDIHSFVKTKDEKAKCQIKELFCYYEKYFNLIPQPIREIASLRKESNERAICDFIAQMTDLEALAQYEYIFSPRFRRPSRFPNGRPLRGTQLSILDKLETAS